MNYDLKLQELRELWIKASNKDRKILEGRARLLKYAQEELHKNGELFELVKETLAKG